MSLVRFKLKKTYGTNRLADFHGQPSWEGLALKINKMFIIPLEQVGVAYIDKAKDAITLTNEEELQSFYATYSGSGEFKFIVQDLKTPDDTPTIAATWSAGSNISDLSQSGK
ncbi:hypothetical protein BYT27DRAFT_6426880 [Phlegmacium glaucopus]|nr:hypothetical protein BYT27DRAFT_6426880 [Phlegmacium glaucopus]